MIAFMRFLKDRGTTTLVAKTEQGSADQLMSLSDGVVTLERDSNGRRINVVKHRGIGEQNGSHGMAIRNDGIEAFPSLRPDELETGLDPSQVPSGIEQFDVLLDGGFEQGTVTIISGPTGVGKSTIATAGYFTKTVIGWLWGIQTTSTTVSSYRISGRSPTRKNWSKSPSRPRKVAGMGCFWLTT